MSDNIKVVVKVRPLISREIEDKSSYQWRVKNNTLYQLDQNGRDFGPAFTFDKVYDKDTKTSDVYKDIAKPIVEAATAGFNGTIFAYGQTSSGKTYTMTGSEESPGIIPLAVLNLFEIIKNVPDRDFLVRVSYIEIYNETLKDLLNVEKDNIKIHESLQGIKVDVTEKVTSSPEEVLEAMREGEANRQTGATNMNEKSSRSHSIFQITIESRDHIEGEEQVGCVNVSQLNLVDLAGSERSGQTGATGLRFKEGTHINKSLSALALVIKQLSEDPNKYANYRDSKLTRILQNSLGGNAKTSIICAVTPAAVEETISTLQFANRAKAIKNKPEVNAVATDATMIQSLTKQLSKLQSQLESKKKLEVILESKKHVEQDNYNLQKQIAQLQKLILNGFGQRRSVDAIGTRRKQPPRRITISTLSTLHAIEEDPAPTVPRFCTPALKYNPMSFPSAAEFVPIQNPSNLSGLPEEPVRLVTPPPHDKKVNFSDEIIELDSDDDDSLNVKTCSPYHKCYGSSKTPPCVLRKNAKLAEKNLKDIVELTEREKMYTPSVVEFIEKLEQNTAVIAKLQDEVDSLHKQGKEKDFEMDQLKNKIKKTEEQVQTITSAKLDLESQCNDYNIKLTDWEVSYETLKKKSKLREEELLSRLDEQKHRKPEDLYKLLPRTLDNELSKFMDMSKDVSVDNSDNESSTIRKDDSSPQIKSTVSDLHEQLTFKNQIIIELEANICAQKQRIEFLENSSHELREIISSFKEKLNNIVDENSLLKSTIDTLNSTINIQKSNLIIANNDIDSYNSVIQELQIKLTQKENILNMNISDSMLENMIANEERFIANNENMKNIILSFKTALDTRNEEINHLKTKVQYNSDANIDKNLKDLETMANQIETLNTEVQTLQEQIKENITTIDKLVREKDNLIFVEQDFTRKLAAADERTSEVEKLNKENTTKIKTLKENNEKLTLDMASINVRQQEVFNSNKVLVEQIEGLKIKIMDLEQDNSLKNNLIASLKKEDEKTRDNLEKAKLAMHKLQDILVIVTGDIQEVPDIIDNFVNIFNILSNNLNTLETVVVDIVSQKEEAVKDNTGLKHELSILMNSYSSERNDLLLQIENLKETANICAIENEKLKEEINKLTKELPKTQIESNRKIEENTALKTKLTALIENNVELQHNILSKDNIISTLKDIESTLSLEKQALSLENKQVEDNLKQNIEKLSLTLKSNQNQFDQILQDKNSTIIVLEKKCAETCKENTILAEKLNNAYQNRDKLMEGIINKVSQIIDCFNFTNRGSCEFEQHDVNVYEQIILSLDKIANHISILTCKNVDQERDNMQYILSEAKEQIGELTQENMTLIGELSQIKDKNQELFNEIDRIQSENRSLNGNLMNGHELLKDLQLELKMKSNEIKNMEIKVKEWKDQFVDLDILMKHQMHKLQAENEKLVVRFLEMKQDTRDQINRFADPECSDFEVFEMKNVKINFATDVDDTKHSPKSLVTICCSKILDYIQPKENNISKVTPSSSTSDIVVKNAVTQANKCRCDQLTSQLENTQKENSDLISIVEQLKLVNQHLVDEREEVCKEVKLLLEPAYELQKKIVNHKTNLSILTATTYAENKSLKSQVKGLQHHHTRFHNVCQRDIPAFKKQLGELLTILKAGTLVTDTQNVSFKRYSLPDVLDNNNTLSNLRNESTLLDGDLLMLDTNVTLTTTADNTLVGYDQSYLDLTQTLYNEASCQTSELNQATEPSIVYSHIELLNTDNESMFEKLDILKEENRKLRDQVDRFPCIKESKVDSQNSPIKIHSDTKYDYSCEKCNNTKELFSTLEQFQRESKVLSQDLTDTKTQKEEIEKKYNNLKLEIPSSDALVRKLSVLEKDYSVKINEVAKLTSALSNRSQQIKILQEENDTLSTQVMENISEADDLNKELEKIKQTNVELTVKCSELEKKIKQGNEKPINTTGCSQCVLKDKIIQSIQSKDFSESHTKLNRSYSDSDTSSRHNKICTLQSELHAGREDCKQLTEEVTTIKQHLERSNISMDLDESIGESNIYAFTKDVVSGIPQSNTCSMPDIQEEGRLDMYALDKIDCLNYFVEKTGNEKKRLNCDAKIIDVMKMLYNNLVANHNDEVENLINKLRDYEEMKNHLRTQLDNVTTEHTKMTKELDEKNRSIKSLTDVLSQIKSNINAINNEMMNPDIKDDENTKLVNVFKENLLKLLDTGFGLSSVNVFDSLFDKIIRRYENDLLEVTESYTKLQDNIERLTAELSSVNNNLSLMKCQLSDKETEYNLLKAQKERIHEISNAVTLDIIKKEQELNETITKGYQKLLKLNIINPGDIDLSLPLNKNISLLIEHLINQYNNKVSPENEKLKENLVQEIKQSKITLVEREMELQYVKTSNEKLQEMNDNINRDLVEKENKLDSLKTLNSDLNNLYNSKVDENTANLNLIGRLTEEIEILKQNIVTNEATVLKLSEENGNVKELIDKVKVLQEENERINSINDMINKEKDTYASELDKSGETIRRNNTELNKMTSDILALRESIKENSLVIESLKCEAQSLTKQNSELKEQFEEKCRDWTRLDKNTKIHEKTVETQSKIIKRLQKQKDEDDKAMSEKTKQLEELSAKCMAAQKECDALQNSIKAANNEISELKTAKESLKARVSELEAAIETVHKRRSSIDSILDSSRRRRQSLHDSKRIYGDGKHDAEDGCNLDAVFETRHKSDELFMDVDDDVSNRSSPIRLSKGRDSLLSRTDQSEKEEDLGSRASSVVARRRRRQSTHDLHRSELRHTPSPHDHPSTRLLEDMEDLNNVKRSETSTSEVAQLKEQLASYQHELEDLKEKYKELDDECETCAEYLRERDEQCRRLKKEKTTLEHLVTDLKTKLESSVQQTELKRSVADASVNTDEDWSNLHSVVVDRMSYDAEVEKNKKLTKIIEELRFQKQKLNNNIDKMQKALEKHSVKDNRELVATKQELQSCKEELKDLKQRCKELDEECETCAEYLKERDEQCRKLKDAKAALEAKLQEQQDDSGALARAHSLRKKRQTVHDLNRTAAVDLTDAFTETSDDFLSYQVERDDSSQREADETPSNKMKRLKATVDKLTQQKAALEKQLMSASKTTATQSTMYVATGSAIVQNQQLTDVMKENQKLKKINAKLVNLCKKRGKSEANRENEDPCEQG